MIAICAWCKKSLGEKPPHANGAITHGICDECREKIKRDNDTLKKSTGGSHAKN